MGRADLVELELTEPVDAVFSNAVFHWIPDHDRAVRSACSRRSSPAAGWSSQCGGEGNIDDFHGTCGERRRRASPYAELLRRLAGPGTSPRRRRPRSGSPRAGFTDVDALAPGRAGHARPSRASSCAYVCLGHHLERLPEELQDPFVDDVLRTCRVDPLVLDYVRLNIDATKADE